MTTIAYDGRVLAADSLVTCGTMRFGHTEKIIKLNDGRYFAMAGSIELSALIASWLNGETEKPELKADDKCNGIVVSPNGKAFELSNSLRIFPACIPWAGGSGDQVAMTAMRCGKDAEAAVRLACEMDIYSGMPVSAVIL